MSYAVVTGASSGIGAALTKRLLSDGWKVILVSRSESKMKSVTRNFPSDSYLVISCDVTDQKHIKAACEKTISFCQNKLSVLINNAGGGIKRHTNMDDISEDLWNNVLKLNLTAPFLFTKYLKQSLINAATMKTKKDKDDTAGASIINIGSMAAVHFFNESVGYGVAKAGLGHLTKCNALELSKYKVRCNVIMPAWVKTPNLLAYGYKEDDIQEFYKQHEQFSPLGRIGNTQDIVEMAMFLIDKKKSGWITGQEFRLDGGRSLIPPRPPKKSKL